MKQYRLINNMLGWVTFVIASWVYCSTVEPTASFWDCPEFITTGYKLEVGHPPGAPFFMLTANLFSQFASDPSHVALMVNMMSALMSGGCILFLFWSITHLARKLICPAGVVMTAERIVAIESCGLVGAFVYAFSDTFWFSAVEGEVYAYSSLFTALVFWLILKWEEHADEPHSDRWLVLIAYLTGISIGVHLLNLLCLPAIVLIWYFKKNPDAGLKGSLCALCASFVLVAAVLYGIVPGIVKVGGWFELLFVNVFSLPFNSGLIFYIFCLIVVVLWAVWETFVQKSRKRMNIAFLAATAMLGIPFYGYGWTCGVVGVIVIGLLSWLVFGNRGGKALVSPRVLNTSLLCMLMIMIGYSSYAVIVIRSTANPPMDQNSPEDIFTLGQYLNREQYGSRPLFYGQAYTSQVALDERDGYCVPRYKEGAPVYERVEKHSADEKDAYRIVYHNREPIYAQNMLFPRMYSSSSEHVQAYEDWLGGVKGHVVTFDKCGQLIKVKVPTQGENLRFFFSYQLNFMYWRYFLWNFAGRQNDIQGNGEREHGNWLSGFSFIDTPRLGDQSKMPSELKNNKGHNVFYCLPLLLGLLGLFWQAYKGQEGVKQFWVVFFLFFMTGLAIVVYLNQTPLQPRERDYAYAGSFYAFSIWVGLGVAAIGAALRRLKKLSGLTASIIAAVLALCVPIQMVSQTWDDHDRSGRYTCRDFGHNYLNSMDEGCNPVIYTNGDNDTFPLWYNQDTEGVRTDARVCNLSYLQTDWYIDQMCRPAYDSPSLPISWSRLQYVTGEHEAISVQPDALKQVIDYLKGDSASMKELLGDNPYELRNIIQKWVLNDNADFRFIPTDSMVVTVDKDAVQRSGMMIAGDSIPDVMVISLKGENVIYKNRIMMLEMISHGDWERPLYMSTTVGSDNYGHLGENFVQEGLACRITPFNTKKSGRLIDSERMYNNMMNKFKYGGIKENPNIYLDETISRMCYTHRRLFAILATTLINEGKDDKALNVLRRAEEEFPSTVLPHNFMGHSIDLAQSWFRLAKQKLDTDTLGNVIMQPNLEEVVQGTAILEAVGNNSIEYLEWYLSLPNDKLMQSQRDCYIQLSMLYQVASTFGNIDKEKEKEWGDKAQRYIAMCYQRGVKLN